MWEVSGKYLFGIGIHELIMLPPIEHRVVDLNIRFLGRESTTTCKDESGKKVVQT